MMVKLDELRANPFRDMHIDPIDEDVVAALQDSIERHGFWGGVICRRQDDEIQIAAGHHRVIAAMRAGLEVADITVSDSLSDLSMIQIYATENATQRGNTGTAQAGSVASALKFIAKAILTEGEMVATIVATMTGDKSRIVNSLRGALVSDTGIGEHVIYDSGILSEVKGLSQRAIRDQLALLKSSGAYARIIADVQEEIEAESQHALEELEAARLETERLAEEARQAEERRKAMEEERKKREEERQAKIAVLKAEREQEEARRREEKRKADEERKAAAAAAKEARDQAREREREAKRIADEERAAERARILQARIEEEEKQAALARQQEEMARERERIEAELAERQRKESAAEYEVLTKGARASQEAVDLVNKAKEAAAKRPVTFDFEGVSKHFKSTAHINTFRQVVTGTTVKPYLDIQQQAELAGHLVRLAQERGAELTSNFIRENTMNMLFRVKDAASKMDAEDKAAILRQDKQRHAKSLQEDAIKSLWNSLTAFESLGNLLKDWPKDMEFELIEGWRDALSASKQGIERMERNLKSLGMR